MEIINAKWQDFKIKEKTPQRLASLTAHKQYFSSKEYHKLKGMSNIMGIPKHGKLSAKTKKCQKYRAEGRLEKNKARKIAKHEKFMAKKAAKKSKQGSAS